jgi:uncharacterized protein YciI
VGTFACLAEGDLLFVIQFSYQVPLEEVDALKEAHYRHLDEAFARGLYLLAGPKVPRTGGLILADGDRDGVEAFVAGDPFVTSGAATATVTEFVPTRAAGSLSGLVS